MQQSVGPDIFSKPLKVKWEEIAPLLMGQAQCIAMLLQGSCYVCGEEVLMMT